AWVAVPVLDGLQLRWFARDLDARGELVANTLSDSLADALASGDRERLERLFARAALDERLYAIGLCDRAGTIVGHSAAFPEALDCAGARDRVQGGRARLEMFGGPLHI